MAFSYGMSHNLFVIIQIGYNYRSIHEIPNLLRTFFCGRHQYSNKFLYGTFKKDIYHLSVRVSDYWQQSNIRDVAIFTIYQLFNLCTQRRIPFIFF